MTTLMRNGRDRRSGKPVKCHARKERVLLVGTRSANHIRASGHSGCTQRPDTWLHPNASRKRQIPLASRAPSIHGTYATWRYEAFRSAFRAKACLQRLKPESNYQEKDTHGHCGIVLRLVERPGDQHGTDFDQPRCRSAWWPISPSATRSLMTSACRASDLHRAILLPSDNLVNVVWCTQGH
jgi:hypothetical protein